MTESKRESIIQQLSLVSGYSEQYFRKLTDRHLRKEMERYHGKDN
ncbi:hypothetical protein SAMN04487943_101319 [Gracilibacillus orientalis]|uniref:Uncharacterized protein n=1 Tax=Gracilibacillus orientalis TaxID=334253 RepID=A0A1I4HC22_9BACI|nr:hypothetical protein [Gracilibacillus orientalis]SFL39233.1 hypothetical protein SAMN04487943_101319 [Gracilibacillus orientalis]